MKNTEKDNRIKDGVMLDVYVMKLPKRERSAVLYPPEREEKVKACKSDKVQAQKYYVWKLLEYALENSFQCKITDLKFIKNERGKWTSPFCFFSLSHSENALAVALSNSEVGVDIEKLTPHKNDFLQKILTEEERKEFSAVSAEAQTEYLLGKWTGKESIFKTLDKPRFRPEKMDAAAHSVESKRIEIDGEEYMLSVAAERPFKARYFFDEGEKFLDKQR